MNAETLSTTTIRVGSYVEGGDSFEDYDRGEVVAIDGNRATVAWHGANQTIEVPLSVLRPWTGDDVWSDPWPFDAPE